MERALEAAEKLAAIVEVIAGESPGGHRCGAGAGAHRKRNSKKRNKKRNKKKHRSASSGSSVKGGTASTLFTRFVLAAASVVFLGLVVRGHGGLRVGDGAGTAPSAPSRHLREAPAEDGPPAAAPRGDWAADGRATVLAPAPAQHTPIFLSPASVAENPSPRTAIATISVMSSRAPSQSPFIVPTASLMPSQAPSRSLAPTFTHLVNKVLIRLVGDDVLSLTEVMVYDQYGNNVALHKPTRQSSVGYVERPASNANNGNLQDFTHTGKEQGAWWEVDLKGEFAIARVVVHNRFDFFGERSSNSDVILNSPGTSFAYHIDIASTNEMFDIPAASFKPEPFMSLPSQNIVADKVRVQLVGHTYSSVLSLREVRVIDQSGNNAALHKPTRQSSTHATISFPASNANNGNREEYTHTIEDQEKEQGIWWEVDLGGEFAIERVVVDILSKFWDEQILNFDVILSNLGQTMAVYHIKSSSKKEVFDIPGSYFVASEFSHADVLSWSDSPFTSIHGIDLALTNIGAAVGAKVPTNSSFDTGDNLILVSASPDIEGIADEFSYLHSCQSAVSSTRNCKKEEGDFFLSIFIESFANKFFQSGAKAGIMIRESLDPSSRHVFLHVGGIGQVELSTRYSTGQLTSKNQDNYLLSSNGVDSLYPEAFQRGELRLKKVGNTVTGFVRAATEDEWTVIPSVQVDFERFYVGIAITSHSSQIRTLNCSTLNALTWFNTVNSNTLNVLQSFYEASRGTTWRNGTGWLETKTYCQWSGVECNKDDEITAITLSDSNLTGSLAPSIASKFYGLGLDSLHFLEHIDLSHNSLSGEADVLLSPAVRHVNFSHNKFIFVRGFIKSESSYDSLETLDLSHNTIAQDVSDILSDIPPYLKILLLSDNMINGTLPDPFPILRNMERFAMDNNALVGKLPDGMQLSLSVLTDLSFANQHLSGTIPVGLFTMPQLRALNLSKNNFTGSIPTVTGNLNLEVLDLSNNGLVDAIPPGLAGGVKDRLVLLSGNPGLFNPAPVSLCLMKKFDQNNDPKACPLERNALRKVYLSSKGFEWTEALNWGDEHTHHCNYFGVTCDPTNTSVLELVLNNNGLSGKLSESIANLSRITKLDLGDNNIQGRIPTEIGLLLHLTYLRLSHNTFIDVVPSELSNLRHLSLFHLHGNRIQGTIPRLESKDGQSSFITDCGVPTDFDTPVECEDCNFCCNANGDCHMTEETIVKKAGFSYLRLSLVLCLCLVASSCLVVMLSYLYERRSHEPPEAQQPQVACGQTPSRRPSSINREKQYALDTIGTGSVYSFFLSKNLVAWTSDSIVLALQYWMLFQFIAAAELDFSSEKSAFVYGYKCPRNSDKCKDESETDPIGWIIFTVIMVSHLLADIISGTKLLILAGKQRQSRNHKIRLFVGGFCLCSVSVLTLFASIVYNLAIARSNPDIIVNSIIILFITDIDEKFYKLMRVINKGWVDKLKAEQNAQAAGITGSAVKAPSKEYISLEDELNILKIEVARLAALLERQNKGAESQRIPEDLDSSDQDQMVINEIPVAAAQENNESNAPSAGQHIPRRAFRTHPSARSLLEKANARISSKP